MMKTEMLDLNNDEQYSKEIFMTFDDNGDWEYTRLGFGEDHIGLYLVDLDDTGEELREKLYINDRFSACDVIEEGLAHNVFVKYSEDDICWNIESNNDFEKFLKVVLAQ